MMRLQDLHKLSDDAVAGDSRRAHGPKQQISVSALARAYQCARYPVLDRIFAEYQLPFDIGVLRTMAMGKQQESLARVWLLELGVHVRKEQECVTDSVEPFPVLGYYDYELPNGDLIEMKTVHDAVFRTYVLPVADGAPMVESGYWLFPQYYRQLQAYLWLAERDRGWFLFWRRDAVEFRFVEVPRDEACIDELKAQAAVIREHCTAAMKAYVDCGEVMHPDVLAALPPHPQLDTQPPCARCSVRNVCEPGKRYILQSTVVDDDYLGERLIAVEECEDSAKRKKVAWSEATDRLNSYWDANAPDARTFEVAMPAHGVRMVGKRRKDGARVWKRTELIA